MLIIVKNKKAKLVPDFIFSINFYQAKVYENKNKLRLKAKQF